MTKFAVLGTGSVGQTIATVLVEKGFQVMMGSRTKDNQKGLDWLDKHSKNAHFSDFAEACEFGDIIFSCTSGLHSLEALKTCSEDSLAEKILIDVSNPLDFSQGFPPKVIHADGLSLAEEIQNQFPRTKVVKSLNMVNSSIMTNPQKLSENTDLFISGNDSEAKGEVEKILKEIFSWKKITDLGDIKNARGMEMYLAFWISMYHKKGTGEFNIKVIS